MSFLKTLEKHGRNLRCYILPKFRKSAKLTQAQAVPIPTGAKVCILDFASVEIDSDMARYLCLLVLECRTLGYHITFVNRHKFLSTTQHKRFKQLAFKSPFSLLAPDDAVVQADLVITDRKSHGYSVGSKTIHLDYTHTHVTNSDEQFALPFFVHPEIYHTSSNSKPSLDTPRPIRVLFAGNAQRSLYDRPVLKEKYALLSRVQILDSVKEQLDSSLVREPTGFEQLIQVSVGASPNVTIATTETCSIPSEKWLSSLQQADFYLACPGVDMPLCHNLIEALSAGSIPILQYNQYLSPALVHKVNSLVFTDQQSLATAINEALNMSQQQISELRHNARQYYLDHHQAGAFLQKVITSPEPSVTLFLNSFKAPI